MPFITIDWACDGLTYALERQDIVVIVDTLRFSSAVVTAVAHGYTIIPAQDRVQGRILAEKENAVLAQRSDESGVSISPGSFVAHAGSANKTVVLPSPNGGKCSAQVKKSDDAYIGCFLNAQALSELVTALAYAREKDVTVIACGEQRSIKNGERIVYIPEQGYRVFALEDYLAAGAIITYASLHRSAEAEVSARAFAASKNDLVQLLRDSFSGRYLVERGMTIDIDHAAQMNMYNVVPQVLGGTIVHICAATVGRQTSSLTKEGA